MRNKKEKPLLQARGGIHIGESFINSANASWPFGKIEVYKDRIILKLKFINESITQKFSRGMYKSNKSTKIPTSISLSYSDIAGYKELRNPIFLWPLASGINFIHKIKKYPPYLNMSFFGGTTGKIIQILESHGKERIETKYNIFNDLKIVAGALSYLLLFGAVLILILNLRDLSLIPTAIILAIVFALVSWLIKTMWRKIKK